MINDAHSVNSYDELKQIVPTVSCVYFIYSGDELAYVGKSSNLHRRFKSHHREPDFETLPNLAIRWEEMDEEKIHSAEKAYIRELTPRLNAHIAIHRVGESVPISVRISDPELLEWLESRDNISDTVREALILMKHQEEMEARIMPILDALIERYSNILDMGESMLQLLETRNDYPRL